MAADGRIDYDAISNMLSKFTSLREECSSNTKESIEGIQQFQQTGLNTDYSNYVSELAGLNQKMNTAAATLEEDYDRIIKYLNRLVNEIQLTHQQAISIVQAIDIWKATETVTKG